jgi:hypothetical protein
MSERVESLSTWWKPVDGGSNPSAPTPTHSQCNRPSERARGFCTGGALHDVVPMRLHKRAIEAWPAWKLQLSSYSFLVQP